MGRVTLNLGVRWDRYRGWMPEQRQIAVHDRSGQRAGAGVPRAHFFTWNSFGPRIGMTYDLAGDGKTVIKASYGLFWHNPGPASAPTPTRMRKQERHLQLDRRERRSPRTSWVKKAARRPHDPCRHDSARSEHHAAVFARRAAVLERQLAAVARRARRLRLQVRRRSDRARINPAARSAYTRAVRRSSTSAPDGVRGTARRPDADALRRAQHRGCQRGSRSTNVTMNRRATRATRRSKRR